MELKRPAKILLIIVGIAGGCLLLAALLINPIAREISPQLAQIFSKAAGHDVRFAGISAALLPKTAIVISDLSLEPEASTSTAGQAAVQNRLSVGSLSLATNLWGLLRRNIDVTEVALRNISGTVVRRPDGKVFVGPALISPRGELSAAPQPEAHAGSAALPPPPPPAGSSLRFAVRQFRVEGLSLDIVDETASPPQQVVLKQAELTAADIFHDQGRVSAEVQTAGAIDLEASVAGPLTVGEPSSPSPVTSGLTLSLRLPSLQQIPAVLAAYGVSLPQTVLSGPASAKALLRLDGQNIGAKMELDLTEASLRAGIFFLKPEKVVFKVSSELTAANDRRLKADSFSVTLGDLQVHSNFLVAPAAVEAQFTAKDLALQEAARFIPPLALLSAAGSFSMDLKVQAAGAQLRERNVTGNAELTNASLNVPIKAKGSAGVRLIPLQNGLVRITAEGKKATAAPVNFDVLGGTLKAEASYSLDKDAAFSAAAAGLSLAQCSQVFLAGSPLSLTGTLHELKAHGSITPQQGAASLAASFDASARDGAVEGVNVIGSTLKKAAELPLLANIASTIPAKYQALLSASNTQFSTASAAGRYAGGAVELSSIRLTHPLYELDGSGVIKPDGSLRIAATLRLSAELLAEAAAKEPRIKMAADEQGRLEIPLIVSAHGGPPLVLPDLVRLGRRTAANASKEAAKQGLEKLLPGAGSALDSLFR